MRVQGDALRSGGQRKLALPDPGPDPTDADALFAALRARRRELSGERRLLVAVVMTAFEDLRRYPSNTRLHVAARAWFMSDDEEWPLAFLPACTVLELDPDAVRKQVHEALVARGAA